MNFNDMKHTHIYDKDGNQLCCTQAEKIYQKAGAQELIKEDPEKEKQEDHTGHHHSEDDGHDHGHDHSHDAGGGIRLFIPPIISFVLLMIALAFDNGWIGKPAFFKDHIRLGWYLLAYAPVALPVIREMMGAVLQKELFSEFTLMVIATVGAFAIGEYPEAVAVMLFYAVGEVFQTLAVSRAKKSIQSLLDQRPDEATVLIDGKPQTMRAEEVSTGSIIQLKPGEKLGLDGELVSEQASFNTAALTGESKPDTRSKGETVLAGMINLNSVAEVKVTTAYTDSKLSKILELVQNAATQKAPTELFIRKFAKIYTPVVVLLAVLICFAPAFFVDIYVFSEWLYRALIFLVISCPCALVISIPLGYFGGIGAGSRHGILFKGSNFLDVMAGIQHVVMDKTGTMTKGVFKVQEVKIEQGFEQQSLMDMVNALESKSTHPVATAIHEYVGEVKPSVRLDGVEEIAGHGLKALVDGKPLLVGNFKLMEKFGIGHGVDSSNITDTVIAIAYDGKFAGYISIADEVKENAADAVRQLHTAGVKATMLSGDKNTVVQKVAKQIGIDQAFGDLLPEDKVIKLQEIKKTGDKVAFAGDGVNDAPVVALSDAGIAMGGLGSDATIETADIVIQDDSPVKIPVAMKIGQATKRIVWQNIILAFVVKGIVLILGAGGLATMWEAVFADVGVALIAILNAVRIQRMRFL